MENTVLYFGSVYCLIHNIDYVNSVPVFPSIFIAHIWSSSKI